jgi:NADH:ubiquinone oxidoreductase subunit F (NADH-binding)/NADH:ubiquinone oxidoreductase subunit E
MIVQQLHHIQEEHGYLPEVELRALAERSGIPLYRIQEVASFFPHYRLRGAPATVEVKVCRDMSCHLRGAGGLRQALLELGNEYSREQLTIEGVSCLGRCDRAPACVINEHVYVGRGALELQECVRQTIAGAQPKADSDADLATDAGQWRIDVYAGRPTYEAVRRFIRNPDAQGMIEALRIADLRGMGGAGVWAHQKWNDVRQAEGDRKYIICNADESEPGTFKDRELLLRTPYLVLEGVILAGLVTNASQGYIYIRHEYQEEIEAMRRTIALAQNQGICGPAILDSGRSFPVEVFVSPGGYICGEQSALVEAMEDHRAEPRNRPPQLETNGLFDKPTLVSNVETFAWAPAIALRGGEWYRDQGANGCKGLRFFSISGDVERPGVYEVANGLTLRELVNDRAGGMRGGQKLKAVAPSGPSGGFLPARVPTATLAKGFENRLPEAFQREKCPAGATHMDVLDLYLDLQFFRDLGLMLGAGIVIYGEQADMVDQALNCLEFFRNESCGKCVPCRIGSQKLVGIGTDIMQARVKPSDRQDVEGLVRELAATMTMTSICGLGAVAANPLTSVLRSFSEDVARYISEARRHHGEKEDR